MTFVLEIGNVGMRWVTYLCEQSLMVVWDGWVGQ